MEFSEYLQWDRVAPFFLRHPVYDDEAEQLIVSLTDCVHIYVSVASRSSLTVNDLCFLHISIPTYHSHLLVSPDAAWLPSITGQSHGQITRTDSDGWCYDNAFYNAQQRDLDACISSRIDPRKPFVPTLIERITPKENKNDQKCWARMMCKMWKNLAMQR